MAQGITTGHKDTNHQHYENLISKTRDRKHDKILNNSCNTSNFPDVLLPLPASKVKENMICYRKDDRSTDSDATCSVSLFNLSFLSITESSFIDSLSLSSTVAYSHEIYAEKDDESSLSNFSLLGIPYSEPSQSTLEYKPITTSEPSISPDESSTMLKKNMATIPLIDFDRNQLSFGNSIQLDQIRNKFRSLAAQYYGVASIRLSTSCNLRDSDSDNFSDVLLPFPAPCSTFNISRLSIAESSFADSLSLPSAVACSHEIYPDKDDEWWTSSSSKSSPLSMQYSEPSQSTIEHEPITTSDSSIAKDCDKEFSNNYYA